MIPSPRHFIFIAIIFIILLTAACSPAQPSQPPTPDASQIAQMVALTITFAAPSQTPTVQPSSTPLPPPPTTVPSPTPIRTPPVLPALFQTALINPLDKPAAYVKDTCLYLKNRWDPNNSPPGTVVMPIMIHSITKGDVIQADQISVGKFNELMNDLQQQGFQTITSQQVVDFLEHNAKIPPRSVILIVDDRKRAEFFREHFQPWHDSLGWTVTNAWISATDTPDYLWQENKDMAATGWVDYQAHGVVHNIPISANSSAEFLRTELNGSMDAITKNFGKKPIAFIWPGGGFTPQAAAMAREAGYRIAFTVNPRGPLMYNWIPLGVQIDPARPTYMPESAVNDPLMVLPRYWDTDAAQHLDQVRQIGKIAAQQAALDQSVELEYYDIVCKSQTGELPALKP